MVSFSCEGCGDVLTKKKLDSHRNQCRGATFTCLDCMVHFWGTDYRAHTSCISEAQKYQGALYRPEKEKKGKQNNAAKKAAYIEDVSQITIVEPPPQAPTPPTGPNVFDFYVGSETPNPSTVNLAAQSGRLLLPASGAAVDPPSPSPTTSGALVRFSQLEDGNTEELVQYGTGPVPADLRTPAPRDRKSRATDNDASSSAAKSDKKRKRLHVDTSASPSVDRDLEMTDAPALLHSGLTGGLQKMMTRDDGFPPSPDYSGDNNHVEPSPGSPVKRSKRAKERKHEGGLSSAFMQMITTTKKPARKSSGSSKEKKARKEEKDEEEERPRKQHRKSKRRESGPKMIEYKPSADAAVVVYKGGEGDGPVDPAAVLLGFVDKGPSSERGVSMNKALKRYHRARTAAGQQGQGKSREEKELWKRLRMRRNEAGEVVLFF